MKVYKASDSNIRTASKILVEGGIVVTPTDSNYCVIANPFNKDAVDRIYKMKKMTKTHPLTVMIGTDVDLERFAHSSELVRNLICNLWPGQISFVLVKKSVIPDYVTSGLNTVSILYHETCVLRKLYFYSGLPLVGSSANLSGRGSVFYLDEAIRQIGNKVDFIIDGGPAKYKHNNTIIDLTLDPPHVVRIGAVASDIVRHYIPDLIDDQKTYKDLLKQRISINQKDI